LIEFLFFFLFFFSSGFYLGFFSFRTQLCMFWFGLGLLFGCLAWAWAWCLFSVIKLILFSVYL